MVVRFPCSYFERQIRPTRCSKVVLSKPVQKVRQLVRNGRVVVRLVVRLAARVFRPGTYGAQRRARGSAGEEPLSFRTPPTSAIANFIG